MDSLRDEEVACSTSELIIRIRRPSSVSGGQYHLIVILQSSGGYPGLI